MTSFPLGIASKPSNIVDGLQILAAHVSAAWDEIVGLESELLGGGTGQFILDIRPTAAGSVVLQSRQNTSDTQSRFSVTGSGALKWGSGTAVTDLTLARTAARQLTLTGTEIITPGNTADTALLIKGLAAQTGLLLDVQDSTAASKASITNAGLLTAVNITATSGMTAPTMAPGTNTTAVATTAFVTAAVVAGTPSGIPAGSIFAWGGSAAPAGFLLCDGSAVSRTTYATLFGAISTDWGTGDGSTTFNLPDPRGKALIGAGTGSGLTNRVRATSGGAETLVLSTANLPVHDHGGATTGAGAVGTTDGQNATGSISTSAMHSHSSGSLVAALGAGGGITMAAGGSTNNSARFSYAGTGGGGVVTTGYTGVNSLITGDTGLDGAHAHTFSPTAHAHNVTVNSHTHPIPAQGSATPHTLMQPWLATNWIIKT